MSIKNVISKNGVWKTAPLNDASSSGVVHKDENGKLDKTWQEIHDTIVGGTPCFVMDDTDPSLITIELVTAVSSTENGTYYVEIGTESTVSHIELMTSSADGYPTVVE
jgi:hypothetical protein